MLALQQANFNHITHKIVDPDKIGQFRHKNSYTPTITNKFSENLKRTHFKFGNDNDFKENPRIKSTLSNRFRKRGSVNDQFLQQSTSDYAIFGKGGPKPPSWVSFGNNDGQKLQSSYQLNHIPIKPIVGMREGKEYIDKSKKRMRESKIFKGKALDAIDNHASIPETSYKVAVSTGKIEIATQEKGNYQNKFNQNIQHIFSVLHFFYNLYLLLFNILNFRKI